MLGYNMMSLSSPDSVSVGARPGFCFFKNSPELDLEEIWKRRDIGQIKMEKSEQYSFVG